jgi:hypothetical protein
VLSIFGHEGAEAADVQYCNWLLMARAGLLALELYTPETGAWRQAHMQARFAILNVFLRATEKDQTGGEPFVQVGLHSELIQGKMEKGCLRHEMEGLGIWRIMRKARMTESATSSDGDQGIPERGGSRLMSRSVNWVFLPDYIPCVRKECLEGAATEAAGVYLARKVLVETGSQNSSCHMKQYTLSYKGPYFPRKAGDRNGLVKLTSSRTKGLQMSLAVHTDRNGEMHQKVKSEGEVFVLTPKLDCERADKERANKEEDWTGGI